MNFKKFACALGVSAVFASGAALADNQFVAVIDGSASFISTSPVLAGGDDLITFTGLTNGAQYDFVLTLSGQNLTFGNPVLNGVVGNSVNSGVFHFAGVTGLAATAPFTLTINGTAVQGAKYSGELTVTAVPEPETYALMLAGLGAVGFVARRRKAA